MNPDKPDRAPPTTSLYERLARERQRDMDALDRKFTQLADRLTLEERSLTAFKLTSEKRLGQLWQWQAVAIALSLVNLVLLLFWKR